jgi:hypothetical protein
MPSQRLAVYAHRVPLSQVTEICSDAWPTLPASAKNWTNGFGTAGREPARPVREGYGGLTHRTVPYPDSREDPWN